MNFCEFTGDSRTPHDGKPKPERLCQFAGFEHCTLHKQPLGEHEGWRTCCPACTQPFFVKDSNHD